MFVSKWGLTNKYKIEQNMNKEKHINLIVNKH